MPKRHRVPSTVCLLLAVALGAALSTPAAAALVLSEILGDPARDWNGSGAVDARDDEWVEVFNTGPEPVELADYYLRDALGTDPHLRLSGELAAGAARVFYGSDAAAWQTAQGLTVTGLSLNNAGDTVELHRGVPGAAGSELVDVYIYGDHEAEDDRSIARLPDGSWILYDYYLPYTGSLTPGGSGCAPSPGAPNICSGNVADERASWGALKGDYR
ncbi:MAG: lamin tail domain-containing protein [Candidatus Krumholzibacteriia bacterium]